MKAVLSGEIRGYQRVDAPVVEMDDVKVAMNAVLHLTAPAVAVKVLPGRSLNVEPLGSVIMRSAWSPTVFAARAKAWIRQILTPSAGGRVVLAAGDGSGGSVTLTAGRGGA